MDGNCILGDFLRNAGCAVTTCNGPWHLVLRHKLRRCRGCLLARKICPESVFQTAPLAAIKLIALAAVPSPTPTPSQSSAGLAPAGAIPQPVGDQRSLWDGQDVSPADKRCAFPHLTRSRINSRSHCATAARMLPLVSRCNDGEVDWEYGWKLHICTTICRSQFP